MEPRHIDGLVYGIGSLLAIGIFAFTAWKTGKLEREAREHEAEGFREFGRMLIKEAERKRERAKKGRGRGR